MFKKNTKNTNMNKFFLYLINYIIILNIFNIKIKILFYKC